MAKGSLGICAISPEPLLFAHTVYVSGISGTQDSAFRTPIFGRGLLYFMKIYQIYIIGLLYFLKQASGTHILKCLVRSLYMKLEEASDKEPHR